MYRYPVDKVLENYKYPFNGYKMLIGIQCVNTLLENTGTIFVTLYGNKYSFITPKHHSTNQLGFSLQALL